MQQVLKAISQRPASGKWKPTLSGTQIHDITSVVFDEILQNPQWVKNDLVLSLMRAVFKALEQVPNSRPIPYIVLRSLIEDAFAAANVRKQLVIDFIDLGGGKKQLAINYSLDGLFLALYDESGGEVGTWTLTQGPTLEAITHYFLIRISSKNVDKTVVDETIEMIKSAISDLNANKAFILDDLLKKLQK